MIKLKDILRTGHVTRWQIVRTLRHQTVAEHHYIVAMLAQFIYRSITPHKGLINDELLVLQWALVHDRPEVLTGDLTTMMKQRLRKLAPAGTDPIFKIEADVDPEYHMLAKRVHGSPIAAIVKIADIQEGITFLNTEGVGAHAKKVLKKNIERHGSFIARTAIRFPDYQWVRCHAILENLLNGEDGMMEIEDET